MFSLRVAATSLKNRSILLNKIAFLGFALQLKCTPKHMSACRVMLQQHAPSLPTVGEPEQSAVSWLTKYGTKCLLVIVCLSKWCSVWVSHTMYVWKKVLHDWVCTGHSLAYHVYACLNQCHSWWVCVYECHKRKSLAWPHCDRQWVFRLWVVLFVSSTLSLKVSNSLLLERKKNQNVLALFMWMWFCLCELVKYFPLDY